MSFLNFFPSNFKGFSQVDKQLLLLYTCGVPDVYVLSIFLILGTIYLHQRIWTRCINFEGGMIGDIV